MPDKFAAEPFAIETNTGAPEVEVADTVREANSLIPLEVVVR